MSSFRQTTLATRGRLAFAHFERSSSLIAQHSDDQICNNFASIIRDQAQRFKIWAVDLGLLVPGHGSLDYRVREAETLRESRSLFGKASQIKACLWGEVDCRVSSAAYGPDLGVPEPRLLK